MFIDIIALILIIYGFYSGYSRGLIKTVFDTLSIFIAIIVCLKFSPLVINFIDQLFHLSAGIGFILGFVLTFFLSMFIIRFAGRQIEGLFKAVRINFINKIAGGALMSVVFAFCFSGLLYLADNIKLLPDTAKRTSITYPVLEPMPRAVSRAFRNFQPFFREFWDKTMETVDEVKERTES